MKKKQLSDIRKREMNVEKNISFLCEHTDNLRRLIRNHSFSSDYSNEYNDELLFIHYYAENAINDIYSLQVGSQKKEG